MLKYLYCKEVFNEVPDEISLGISISNCQIRCDGCHSKDLWKDEGTPLSIDKLVSLIDKHKGITCVCFMGSGNREYEELNKLANEVRSKGLKAALYLGEDSIPEEIDKTLFNYIKVGHWDASKGGLDSPTTNQRMYLIEPAGYGAYWESIINHKFLKQNED